MKVSRSVRTNNNKNSYMGCDNWAIMGIETQILVTSRGLIFLAYKSRSTLEVLNVYVFTEHSHALLVE